MTTVSLRRLRPLLFLWPLLISGLSLPGSAHAAFGDIFRPEFRQEPSNEVTKRAKKVFYYLGCYCRLRDGRRIPIPCTFKYEVKGLAPGTGCNPDDPNGKGQCDTGGHDHNDTRPLVFTPPGKVEFDADTNPEKLIVEGNTLATPPRIFAKITHTVPQAGGVLRITGFLTMPQIGGTRWICVSPGCTNLNGTVMDGTVDVRVRGLRPLPGTPGKVTPNHYVKGRNPDNNHLDAVAFSASPFTRAALPQLSNLFFRASGRNLSVNDISLPKGGVFDLSLDWDARGRGDGHREHRDGNDVDINRRGIDCQQDQALRAAVDRVLVGILRLDRNGKLKVDPVTGEPHPFSALLCEPTRFKHIDFTEFFVPTSF